MENKYSYKDVTKRLYVVYNSAGMKIYKIDIAMPYINNNGYAKFNISNSTVVRLLFNDIQRLQVPYLSRKWDGINIEAKSIQETSKKIKKEVINLWKNNIKNCDIAETLSISQSYVSIIIKKHKMFLKEGD
jgi:hypothetical protein